MSKLLWVFTLVGAVLGALVLIMGVMSAQGAPGEAAAAAIAVALAVIPYCLARAAQELGAAKAAKRDAISGKTNNA